MLTTILMDPKALGFLTYIGVFLTVYYSIRVQHKKIKYIIMRKNEKYVIAFWNACSQAIFKEDFFYLYCLVNVECRKIRCFSTDPDIELALDLGEDIVDSYRGKKFNKHTRRMNLVPDFINPKNGLMIEMDNHQKSGYSSAKLLLFGRIRGEKETAVCPPETLDFITFKQPLEIVSRLLALVSLIGTAITFVIPFVVGGDILTNRSASVALLIVTFSLAFGLTIYNIYLNSAPKALMKEIDKYVEEGYQKTSMDYSAVSKKKKHKII